MIKDKRFENLFLLPAAQTKDKTAVSPEEMRQLCEDIKDEFDYVIIDCPAGIERGFYNAIAGADKAIVVTTPEVSAIRDADRIIGLLESAELYNSKLIINRIRTKMVKQGNMMAIEDIVDILAVDLLGVVPEDEKIVISTNKGEPAVMDGVSSAGEAYRRIAKRINGEDVPLMNLELTNSFMMRFKKIIGMY
ncbi:MAG: septum site-determining protein MinD, partial [Eubacteriales bacterium]